MKKNKGLKRLTMGGCPQIGQFTLREVESTFEDPQRRTLTERLAASDPRLRRLDLREMRLRDKDVRKLARCMRANRVVRSLDLSRNGRLTDEGMYELAGVLANNRALLDLTGCRYKDDGFRAIVML